jgi:diamine N-acetyltransferase
MQLSNQNITLRALEPEDLDFLYHIENDETLWEISNTIVPYSKWVLKNYLENATQDIFTAKQFRFAIENNVSKELIGLIDLFDFEPLQKRAGIGIVVLEEFQRNGFAKEALQTLLNYCFKTLQLHQVFANISQKNKNSISLFTTFGFEKVGVKKDWILTEGKFENEILFQLINSNK